MTADKAVRISGSRENTVAARWAGCKTIIFPDDNMSDWPGLPMNPCLMFEAFGYVWLDLASEKHARAMVSFY